MRNRSDGRGKISKPKTDASPPIPQTLFPLQSRSALKSVSVYGSPTYGDFRIHERGHDAYWQMLKQAGVVPKDSEYDDYPRGRAAYNTKTRTYSLFLDRCILKKKSI